MPTFFFLSVLLIFFSSGFSTQHRKYTQKKKSSTNFFPEYLVFVLSCNTENSIPYTRVSQAFGIQTKTFLFVSLFAPKIKLKQTKNNNNSDRNERVYRNYDTEKKLAGKNVVSACHGLCHFRDREGKKVNIFRQNEKIWPEFKFPSHNSIKHSEIRWSKYGKKNEEATWTSNELGKGKSARRHWNHTHTQNSSQEYNKQSENSIGELVQL